MRLKYCLWDEQYARTLPAGEDIFALCGKQFFTFKERIVLKTQMIIQLCSVAVT